MPWAPNEAIIIGMTRMGLLHNFARLTAGDSPDRMNGGVHDWVEVTGFSLGEIEFIRFLLSAVEPAPPVVSCGIALHDGTRPHFADPSR